MKLSNEQKLDMISAYNSYNGKWPDQLSGSGVMFYNGLRITKADFRAMKKDGINSDRFN